VTCPLCQKRPAKRTCPALGDQICPTCCATKRIVEIRCPEDCRHLDTAQRHPSATVRRQIDADVTVLMSSLGRLSEPQLQLYLLLQSVVASHVPDGLGRLSDADVAEAAGALAASLETAGRGLIYEETATTTVAEGLRKALKTVVDEIIGKSGSRAEGDLAVVFRGIERGARHEGGLIGDGPMDFLTLVARVLPPRPAAQKGTAPVILTP